MDTRIKRAFLRGAFAGLGLLVSVAIAATFNLFSPATGILKGNSSTYVTTAAASSDVIGLFTGCSGTQYLGADGACHNAGGSPANPTALVGLTAINGTASSFIRSDGAPALDQSITPVWTGAHEFDGGVDFEQIASNVNSFQINAKTGTPGVPLINITGSTTTGNSNGISMRAGTNASDFPLAIANATGTNLYLFHGDGGLEVGAPTGGDKGAGTINATGLFVNGTAVGGSVSSANPTASVGLTAVNGVAATYMRSDAAPALSQAISPTWTGHHAFIPSSGTQAPIEVDSIANAITAAFNNNTLTAGQSLGVSIEAGTNSSDYALLIRDANVASTYLKVYGDGGVVAGNPTGGDKGLGTLNVSSNLYINNVAVASGPITCTTACNVSAIAVGQSAYIVKGSNTSRNTTITPALDPDLQFTSVPAGHYTVQAHVAFNAGAGGILSGPFTSATFTTNNQSVGFGIGYAGNPTCISSPTLSNISVQGSHSGSIDCSGSNANGFTNWTSMDFLPTGSGTFGFDWSQSSSNGANTTVNSGSFIVLTRLQ